MLAWLRKQIAAYKRCQCGLLDGGPYGFREHFCSRGCPDHGPCTHGACPYQ